jgi:hypothetical protein
MIDSRLTGLMGMMGAVTAIGFLSLPVMAQNRDTNPLCYFVDANGYRQDLTAWCGQPRVMPSNTAPSSSSTAPLTPDSSNQAPNSSATVTLLGCQVQEDDPSNRASSRRRIVHLTGQVINQTGQPAQNVTVRYAIRSQGSLLDRRGQKINEPVLAPNAVGVFDRKDQPISIELVRGAVDNNWQAEVESLEWITNGQRIIYTLPEPQRCSNSWQLKPS